jgi:hypothetical protein
MVVANERPFFTVPGFETSQDEIQFRAQISFDNGPGLSFERIL